MRPLVCSQVFPVAIATSVLLLTSCVMPTQVRPPRTLEAGTVEVTTGLRLSSTYEPGAVPLAPAFALRAGVTNRLELGASVSGLHANAESSLQLIRSAIFDMSLGLDVGYGEGLPKVGHGMEFSGAAPLTAGLNLSRRITLVAMGAPVYWHDTWHTQAGGSIDLRIFRTISLRPSASWLLPLPGQSYVDRLPELHADPYYVLGLDVAYGGYRGYGNAGF
jgi:hypothetical protein